jgi:hypothetical protein
MRSVAFKRRNVFRKRRPNSSFARFADSFAIDAVTGVSIADRACGAISVSCSRQIKQRARRISSGKNSQLRLPKQVTQPYLWMIHSNGKSYVWILPNSSAAGFLNRLIA